MTSDRDVNRIIRSWLEEGVTKLPDRVLDGVLDQLSTTPQRRRWSAWRSQRMNTAFRLVVAAAAVIAVVAGGLYFLPRQQSGVGGPPAASPSPASSPFPAVSPSPRPQPSYRAQPITVAGTEIKGPLLQLTAQFPANWLVLPNAANPSLVGPPDGISLFVSLVDNTFKDPCAHVETSPKVGPTVDAAVAALAAIPNTTATRPVQTTIAGHAATYLEITTGASLPCVPNQFYLWQDSPGGDWWALGENEVFRAWVLQVGSQRVVIAARSYSGTSNAAKAELQGILDSIVFQGS